MGGDSEPQKSAAQFGRENVASSQARSASFGIVAARGDEGRSREQIENEIFQGILKQGAVEERARNLEEEKRRREREELLARVRGERASAIEQGQARPGRSQILLSNRDEPGVGNLLTGSGG